MKSNKKSPSGNPSVSKANRLAERSLEQSIVAYPELSMVDRTFIIIHNYFKEGPFQNQHLPIGDILDNMLSSGIWRYHNIAIEIDLHRHNDEIVLSHTTPISALEKRQTLKDFLSELAGWKNQRIEKFPIFFKVQLGSTVKDSYKAIAEINKLFAEGLGDKVYEVYNQLNSGSINEASSQIMNDLGKEYIVFAPRLDMKTDIIQGFLLAKRSLENYLNEDGSFPYIKEKPFFTGQTIPKIFDEMDVGILLNKALNINQILGYETDFDEMELEDYFDKSVFFVGNTNIMSFAKRIAGFIIIDYLARISGIQLIDSGNRFYRLEIDFEKILDRENFSSFCLNNRIDLYGPDNQYIIYVSEINTVESEIQKSGPLLIHNFHDDAIGWKEDLTAYASVLRGLPFGKLKEIVGIVKTDDIATFIYQNRIRLALQQKLFDIYNKFDFESIPIEEFADVMEKSQSLRDRISKEIQSINKKYLSLDQISQNDLLFEISQVPAEFDQLIQAYADSLCIDDQRSFFGNISCQSNVANISFGDLVKSYEAIQPNYEKSEGLPFGNNRPRTTMFGNAVNFANPEDPYRVANALLLILLTNALFNIGRNLFSLSAASLMAKYEKEVPFKDSFKEGLKKYEQEKYKNKAALESSFKAQQLSFVVAASVFFLGLLHPEFSALYSAAAIAAVSAGIVGSGGLYLIERARIENILKQENKGKSPEDPQKAVVEQLKARFTESDSAKKSEDLISKTKRMPKDLLSMASFLSTSLADNSLSTMLILSFNGITREPRVPMNESAIIFFSVAALVTDILKMRAKVIQQQNIVSSKYFPNEIVTILRKDIHQSWINRESKFEKFVKEYGFSKEEMLDLNNYDLFRLELECIEELLKEETFSYLKKYDKEATANNVKEVLIEIIKDKTKSVTTGLVDGRTVFNFAALIREIGVVVPEKAGPFFASGLSVLAASGFVEICARNFRGKDYKKNIEELFAKDSRTATPDLNKVMSDEGIGMQRMGVKTDEGNGSKKKGDADKIFADIYKIFSNKVIESIEVPNPTVTSQQLSKPKVTNEQEESKDKGKEGSSYITIPAKPKVTNKQEESKDKGKEKSSYITIPAKPKVADKQEESKDKGKEESSYITIPKKPKVADKQEESKDKGKEESSYITIPKKPKVANKQEESKDKESYIISKPKVANKQEESKDRESYIISKPKVANKQEESKDRESYITI